jgi:hypothetical protein
MDQFKASIKLDILNMPQVQTAIELMESSVNDERIPAEIRAEYKERFDAIRWEIPSQDDFEQEFQETRARMRESRERMNNRTWRLIDREGPSDASQT